MGDYLIKENETAILYLHGNAETRAHYHRKALYELFQTMGYHVLAIDYRGYGDSSKVVPNQTTMVEDAQTAFDWLQKYSHPSTSIFIWGHSLGTGVASKLTHELTHPKGIQLYIIIFKIIAYQIHTSIYLSQLQSISVRILIYL